MAAIGEIAPAATDASAMLLSHVAVSLVCSTRLVTAAGFLEGRGLDRDQPAA
jgi:hypothetical protein